MDHFNTLRLGQNGRHFTDDVFKCIFFLNENIWIWIKISLDFVPKGSINNIPALVHLFPFSVISRHWDGEGGWNSSSWKARNCLTYVVHTKAVDALATEWHGIGSHGIGKFWNNPVTMYFVAHGGSNNHSRDHGDRLNIKMPFYPMLNHWGRVTHICVSKLTSIGSDNGSSPGLRQSHYLNQYWDIVNWNLRK